MPAITSPVERRVECRIHGGWFHMPVIRETADHVFVRSTYNGQDRELRLPKVEADRLWLAENGVAR